MESTIITAEQATEIALKFIKKHRNYARLLNATKESNVWHVKFDVGITIDKIALVNVDIHSGQILDFDIPV
jgi:hypothetical protein